MKPAIAFVKRRLARALWIPLLLLASHPAWSRSAAEPPPLEGAAVEQFVQRTREYEHGREAALAEVPGLVETSSPVEISAREKLVADAIRTQRANARRGDLFGPAGAAIQKCVRDDWRRRSAPERSAAWRDLPRVAMPAVNAPYPDALPLATFPPELLAQLPELPEPLEYRFAGPHLILRDVEANMIVDVLPDVLTDPGAPRLGQNADQ